MEDLQQTYQSKFPILSYDKGAKFTKNKFREMLACKYTPTFLLNDVGMYDSFSQLLTNCGLKKFVSMHEHTFIDLNMEFYTTLDVNANDSHILVFRLLGKQHQITYSFMQCVFVFKKDGMCDMPKSFDVDAFWTFLTNFPPPFRPKKGKAMFIKDL